LTHSPVGSGGGGGTTTTGGGVLLDPPPPPPQAVAKGKTNKPINNLEIRTLNFSNIS
jgi:hypothetical protein